MKKLLPLLIFTFIFVLQLFFGVATSNAQVVGKAPAAPTPTPDPTASTWVSDPEVTFVGKAGARSGSFLDWTLQNYNWEAAPVGQSNNPSHNPLEVFSSTIMKIVISFMMLFILAAAFIIIITRGRNLTVKRFALRFIAVLLLVLFSFTILRFIYTLTDIIEGDFLLNHNTTCINKTTGKQYLYISQCNLLNIGFDYQSFNGYRLEDPKYDESVFVSLLLVKATAITYYVMTGILLIRKIILWFFIVVSPIFPILLFFSPVRNTAKIWIGEFFRWLLYAPLFAVLLSGLVKVWETFIPLSFNFSGAGSSSSVVYPTAVNILLGGPGQHLSLTNSVNYTDTFAQYIVALLMLWVVIILPFILLQIFLDYLSSFSFSESNMVKQLVAAGSGFVKPFAPAGLVTAPASSPPPSGAGVANKLPFTNKMAMQLPKSASIGQQASNIRVKEVNADIMKLSNLSLPTIRDIAKYETSMMSSNISRQQDINNARSTLEKIANPNLASTTAERTHFVNLRGKLAAEKLKGNALASSILTAANATTQNRSALMGSKATQGILSQTKLAHGVLPAVNRVQTVSIEDYEAVKKMWEDTYRRMDPPKTVDGKPMSREQWIKNDMDKVTMVTALLSSSDNQKAKEGMDMVAKILPFLLIGGFSQTEVVAYLKAKQEAAKSVLAEAESKKEDEDTLLDTKSKQEEKPKEMTMEATAEAEVPSEQLQDPLSDQEQQQTSEKSQEVGSPDTSLDGSKQSKAQ